MFPHLPGLLVYSDERTARNDASAEQGERVIKVRVTEVLDGD
jgi:hypothetical protein